MSLVSDPHIWINQAEEVRPNAWTLVIGAKGAPDFGFHVEFEDVEFQEIWAGD